MSILDSVFGKKKVLDTGSEQRSLKLFNDGLPFRPAYGQSVNRLLVCPGAFTNEPKRQTYRTSRTPTNTS